MATHISQSCSRSADDIRKPAVAGQFYSASADTLANDVDGFLKSAGVSHADDVCAVIVPRHCAPCRLCLFGSYGGKGIYVH